MARLASQIKAGFYPIQNSELLHITKFLKPNKRHGGRIIDPCSGEGVALAHLAMHLNYEAYANELEQYRAKKSRDVIDPLRDREMPLQDEGVIRTVGGDIAFLHVPTGGVQVCYLNPPYDHDLEWGRLELKFLKTATRYIQPDGILVLVIPESALVYKDLRRYVASFYHDVTVRRFSDANYRLFKQHVIFGRKNQKSQMASKKVMELLEGHLASQEVREIRISKVYKQDDPRDGSGLIYQMGTGLGPRPLTHNRIDEPNPEPPFRDEIAKQAIYGPQNWPEPEPYVPVMEWRRMASLSEPPEIVYRPPTPRAGQIFHYYGVQITPEDVAEDVEINGLHQSTQYQELFRSVEENMANLDPLMPLKEGHLLRVIAAGMLNSMILDNGQERIMLKGTAGKNVVSTTESVPRQDKPPATKQIFQEVPDPRIVTLDSKGNIKEIEREEIPLFLIKWMPQITALTEELYPPNYRFDLAGYSEKIGDRATLFTAQKHIVAATCLRLETERDALIVGEMGTGKTRMGAVVAAVMNYRRVLVACPPHLVSKWIRELENAVPEAEMLHLQSVGDVDTWMERDEQKKMQIGVMKFTTARAASGWRHSFDYWQFVDEETNRKFIQRAVDIADNVIPAQLTEKEQSQLRLWTKWRGLMSRRGVRNPISGVTLVDNKGLPISYADLNKSKVMRVDTSPAKPKTYQYSKERHWYNQAWQFTRQGDPEMPSYRDWAGFAEYGTIRSQANGQKPLPITRNRFPSKARVRLASYIKDKYPLRIDLCIYDEVQQLKAADSDQGMALARLAKASRKNLSMTGTIYGGRASTIFWILYRTADDMRKAYTDRQATGRKRIMLRKWVQDYGMYSWTETTAVEPGSSAQSGTRKTTTTPKEAPGSSPAMLPWLLNRTAFISLADLGMELPSFTEHAIPVTPDEEMADRLLAFDMEFGGEMRKRLALGDKSLLAAYLMGSIMWPDSPWRDEIITDPKTRGTPMEHVIGHIPKIRPFDAKYPKLFHPKEKVMLRQTLDEVKKGNNVLILCEQTRTRNITDQWVEMLERCKLKCVVLDSQKVSAAKREKWIAEQKKKGVQVLIAHAKSIETGLDLLEYPTILWMMVNYSVYTVLQASHRSYRIGQDKPINVYYYYYAGTMQETAVGLVAEKAAAAYATNGDSIDDQSLAAHVSLGSVEEQLMRVISSEDGGGLDETRSAQDYFTAANQAAQKAATIVGGYDMSRLDGQPEEEVTEAPEIVKPKPTTVIEGELVKPADPNQADLDRLAKLGFSPELFAKESVAEVLGATFTPALF
jgi:hypothetical protein